MWRAYTGVIHCAFDQIPNLQNCFTAPNKNLGGEGAPDKHLPFRLKKFFASKRIVSEQRPVSHEIRLFASSIRFPFFRFFRLFSLQLFRNYSL